AESLRDPPAQGAPVVRPSGWRGGAPRRGARVPQAWARERRERLAADNRSKELSDQLLRQEAEEARISRALELSSHAARAARRRAGQARADEAELEEAAGRGAPSRGPRDSQGASAGGGRAGAAAGPGRGARRPRQSRGGGAAPGRQAERVRALPAGARPRPPQDAG
ncbi:unnamed protein product, partial [Prorocentrum cordatum]